MIKKKIKMLKRIVLYTLSVIFVMGMAACSFDTNRGTAPGSVDGAMSTAEAAQKPAAPEPVTPTDPETEISQQEAEKTETPETTAPENKGNEYSGAEEIGVGDPIVGIVDRFADDLIVIKDAGDPDLVYCFSTKNAQVVEGDSPIAAGDMVAITYRGVMGDEEHPGEAVKIVAESMMYQ